MRRTLTLAVLLAGIGGIIAVAQASQEPELVPVSRAPIGVMHLPAVHVHDDARMLSYEPARREREGDDDDQDEPRR
ncbi:hypothetical protein [Bradyrhizobium sp. SRS-191]|uniref:hypothetical protein n=1 Tax=Bradyrhizobium sp. SRS-191 TaxID=2962606 RepID=UPI00211DD5C9|nr:hypothetical protein [Bradyrhizobium sp. SRS-191]